MLRVLRPGLVILGIALGLVLLSRVVFGVTITLPATTIKLHSTASIPVTLLTSLPATVIEMTVFYAPEGVWPFEFVPPTTRRDCTVWATTYTTGVIKITEYCLSPAYRDSELFHIGFKGVSVGSSLVTVYTCRFNYGTGLPLCTGLGGKVTVVP